MMEYYLITISAKIETSRDISGNSNGSSLIRLCGLEARFFNTKKKGPKKLQPFYKCRKSALSSSSSSSSSSVRSSSIASMAGMDTEARSQGPVCFCGDPVKDGINHSQGENQGKIY